MRPFYAFTIIFSTIIIQHAFSQESTLWHDIVMPWDKAPVNLSSLLDAPAGKHGFLGVKGNEFVFENGKRIRFWGTTMTGSACFPSQDLAPAIAERLSRFAINLVRFQDWDAPWADPPLFIIDPNGYEILNREALDRLDFFIHQLANRGIYVCFDGLGSRALPRGSTEMIQRDYTQKDKGAIHFDIEMRSRYLRDLAALWSHRNRYTDHEYRDSPSIVLTFLFNDNSISAKQVEKSIYIPALQQYWNTWQTQNNLEAEAFPQVTDEQLQNFLADLMAQSHGKAKNSLRGLSIKIPLGGLRFMEEGKDLFSQIAMDFMSQRALWNPLYDRFRRYDNRKMIGIDIKKEGNLFSEIAFTRLKRKPFIVSEWGHPWPNTYRAELPLWMSAMACFQEWNGCVSSTYRTNSDPKITHIFAPMEAFNDPCYFGLMPAAALIFHRQDVSPAQQSVELAMQKKDLYAQNQWTPQKTRALRLVETHRVDVNLQAKASGSRILEPSQPENFDMIRQKKKDKQDFYHDSTRELVVIDTDRTQALVGNLKNSQAIDLSTVEVFSDAPFGVVCLSSLDEKALAKSKDILITLVSEARNQGFKSKQIEDGSFVIDQVGFPPIQIQDTPARIFLKTEHANWNLEAIAPDGETRGSLPFQILQKTISFEIGIHGVIYYRLRSGS